MLFFWLQISMEPYHPFKIKIIYLTTVTTDLNHPPMQENFMQENNEMFY